MAIPHQGPNSSAPHAPNQVPQDHHALEADVDHACPLGPDAAEPASRIGTALRSVDAAVPAEMRSVVSGAC
jgi:hypothetical protein